MEIANWYSAYVSENFQPVPVRPPSEGKFFFFIRCLFDLQLVAIFRFLRPILKTLQGRVLDIGAGEMPWRELMGSIDYVAVDVESAASFGMRPKAGVHYYDGVRLPFPEASMDHVICIEVLEHVPDPARFLTDLSRVLRKGGSLILTVPWSARVHHLPNDYHRFTRPALELLLKTSGLTNIQISERGNDIAVIANKLVVLLMRLLKPRKLLHLGWSWIPSVALLPITAVFLLAAHAAMAIDFGSKEDPLGFHVLGAKA